MNYDILPSEDIAADIETARLALSINKESISYDAMCNRAAYHTQQAIEQSLKFYLRDVYNEDETKRDFKTHDVSLLIRKLREHNDQIDLTGLDEISEDITDWEAKSRYDHSPVAKREEIEKALAYAEILLNKVKIVERKIFRNEKLTNEDLAIQIESEEWKHLENVLQESENEDIEKINGDATEDYDQGDD